MLELLYRIVILSFLVGIGVHETWNVISKFKHKSKLQKADNGPISADDYF